MTEAEPDLAAIEANPDYEAIRANVEAIAETALESVPESQRCLIPDGMTGLQKLAWYHKAAKAGAFSQPAVPATDGGAKPAITPKNPDTSSLPVFARLAAGYSK